MWLKSTCADVEERSKKERKKERRRNGKEGRMRISSRERRMMG